MNKGIIFQFAVEWRMARINAVRLDLAATPVVFVSRRLSLERDLAYQRERLAELYRTGSVRAPAKAA